MSKLSEAQSLILDAKYILDLIDLAIDSVAENSSPFTVAKPSGKSSRRHSRSSARR
ncbi:hypothetical protein RZS28_00915 [Methylocapsa polymorpha]|uniref:Uncharacterized protein n=1 Tax=Methylocapsa polymorpha TaxID=3080828 RepID=A0ABZ0HTN2_9HYPH|nr:hypothetical protein RZS28_00915 [Methylocapsa sp. RX1]